MKCTEFQFQEQAAAIANKAQALSEGRIVPGARYAAVKLLLNNIQTLDAWAEKGD